MPDLHHGARMLPLLLLACATVAAPPPAAEAPRFDPDVRRDPAPVVVRPEVAPGQAPQPRGGLPQAESARGPLRLDVVYPAAGSLLPDVDSSFVFGSVGHGGATLRINGHSVAVSPSGGWLAWLPLGSGPEILLNLESSMGTDTVRMTHRLRRTIPYAPPPNGPWIDTTSFSPVGSVWWPRGEDLPLAVRAAPGAAVSLVLPGGGRVPMAAIPAYGEVPAGLRAFDRDTLNLRSTLRTDQRHGVVRERTIGTAPGPMLPGLPSAAGGGALIVEAVLGRDTVRATWPLRLGLLDAPPIVVEINDDWQGTGQTDSLTPGRTAPGASYHWFLPTGTRLAATGRQNGDLRVQLAAGHDAWVAVGEARLLGAGAGLAPPVVGAATASEQEDRALIRLPVGSRPAFRVDETDRQVIVTLYRARGDLNWIRYGVHPSPLIREIRWRQMGPNLELMVDLTGPAWGTRARWERGDLVLEIRRPPVVDPESPLRALVIAVDAGHPPGGSTGPTRLVEADATMAVARLVAAELRQAGATVVMTREDAGPVDLWPRVRAAERAGAHLLVSIHANALPDGVNPWTNHGTSVFYHQPRSLALARAVQASLVGRTGLRDLGVARGDLALVRTTWMPAILTEGMFMIVPEQESALRSPAGQGLYAGAVVEGIRRFLMWRFRVDQTSP